MADFLEMAELMCSTPSRATSRGVHLRVEHQTEDGAPRRDDARFATSPLEAHGRGQPPRRLTEPLVFEAARWSQRLPMNIVLKVWRQDSPTATAASSAIR